MILKQLSQTLSRRSANRDGIELTPGEIQTAIQELMSSVREECRLDDMSTDEVFIELLVSSLSLREKR